MSREPRVRHARGLHHPCVATHQELVQRAESLIPRLRARTEQTDRLRQLPDETRHDLKMSGVARILQPVRYGGCEAPISGMVDILTRIGQGCGSTAWSLAQYLGHNFMLARWPPAAQQRVWGTAPDNLVSGVLIPRLGQATKVAKGYHLSGRWPFASGVNSCDWCILSGMVGGHDDPNAEERYFIVPKDALTIIDTWDAIGLLGSASNDVEVKNLFVPAMMSLPLRHLKGSGSPGSRVNPAPLYRSPSYMTFGILLSSASLGMVEGMLNEYLAQTKGRIALMSGQAINSHTTQHVKVAEAAMSIEAAKAVLYANCDEIMQTLEARLSPNDEARTKYRAAGAFAGMLAFRAANILWDATGARAVFMSNPIARGYRDLCAATRHFTHNWDINAAAHGRVKLGLPLDNPSL